MNILTINAGSSSIKYHYFIDGVEVCNLQFDREAKHYTFTERHQGMSKVHKSTKAEFEHSLHEALEHFEKTSLYNGHTTIEAVGFRVVHGGSKYTKTTMIDNDVVRELEDLSSLAPLHNPPAIALIKEAQSLLPSIPLFAVFDTAFHHTLPLEAYTYALPEEIVQKDIRKYGFHGIACASDMYQLTQNGERTYEQVIICHLGSGCSITAVKNGKSIETSMGFTPLDGLIMMTRPGSIDIGTIVHYLSEHQSTSSLDHLKTLLNKESGMKALAGTHDMKTILERAEKQDKEAQKAIDIFTYKVAQYIGAYSTTLGGCDALVFSGGIGRQSPLIRKRICEKLTIFNIYINEEKNNAATEKVAIHNKQSSAEIWVFNAEEAQQIEREVALQLRKE